METTSVGIVETKYYTFAQAPEYLTLESGAKLGPVTIAYETYGELSPDRDNAILVCHALSGDAHAAGFHSPDDKKPGWWDPIIGPGKALDTNHYFVVCSNALGGCSGSTGPLSINPATGQPYGTDFPFVTIGDMVRAQQELMNHLGIPQWLCVIGGSMGGMQALEWGVHYSDKTKSIVVISAPAISDAQQIAFHAVGRHAILSDPQFDNGRYYPSSGPTNGLAVARMLAHITYLSDDSMKGKFGRKLQNGNQFRYDVNKEFSIESYLDYQGEKFVNRFDANSYLYITKAIDYFDISRGYKNLDEAMSQVRGKTLVISFSSDWLYPPEKSREIVYALARQKKKVSYCNIQSSYGHDSFLIDYKAMSELVSGFIKHTYYPDRPCSKCIANNEQAKVEPQTVIPNSIYSGSRIDLDSIVNLIEPQSRVLDLGCGAGTLLCRLDREKKVDGLGIEINQKNIISAISCGLSVIQADIDEGLTELPDKCFDYVILSMTLQVIKRPDLVLKEMLRIGKKGIVSFPNFGHWKIRSNILLKGTYPITPNLPYSWYETPNRHYFTLKDFHHLCNDMNIKIVKEIALNSKGIVRHLNNLIAEEVVYILAKE